MISFVSGFFADLQTLKCLQFFCFKANKKDREGGDQLRITSILGGTALAHNPGNLGLGIDENTAVVIKDNALLEVVGEQEVTAAAEGDMVVIFYE